MTSKPIPLSDEIFNDLNSRFPSPTSSAIVGKRAHELAIIFARHEYPNCSFPNGNIPAGADLVVQPQPPVNLVVFDIKGTASEEIAWSQLKVSSQASYNAISTGSCLLLRITSVFGRNPMAHIMKYAEDFFLAREDRWSVHPSSQDARQ